MLNLKLLVNRRTHRAKYLAMARARPQSLQMLGDLSDSAESLFMGENSPPSLPSFSPRHLAASPQDCLEAASPASLPMNAGEESGSEGCLAASSQETLPPAFPLDFHHATRTGRQIKADIEFAK